jgi:hypothetical protein
MVDRDAQTWLAEHVATRGPDPQRRRANWNATLARLADDPLADAHVPQRTTARRTWMIAAAAALVIAAGVWRGSALFVADDASAAPSEAAASAPSPAEPRIAGRPRELPAVPPRGPAVELPAPASALLPSPPGRLRDRDHDRDHDHDHDHVAAPPAAEDPPATISPERLALETRLIARARAAVSAHEDAQAIALLQQHAREFGDGAMVEDRRAWLAIVQCRSSAAMGGGSATSFLSAYPRSPYAARVRAACEIE